MQIPVQSGCVERSCLKKQTKQQQQSQGWGDKSVGKVLSIQPGGPEFKPRHSLETARCLELMVQPRLTVEPVVLLRETVSKKQGEYTRGKKYPRLTSWVCTPTLILVNRYHQFESGKDMPIKYAVSIHRIFHLLSLGELKNQHLF